MKSICLFCILFLSISIYSEQRNRTYNPPPVGYLFYKFQCENMNNVGHSNKPDCNFTKGMPINRERLNNIRKLQRISNKPKIKKLSRDDRIRKLDNICNEFKRNFHGIVSNLIFSKRPPPNKSVPNSNKTHVIGDPADNISSYIGIDVDQVNLKTLKSDLQNYIKGPPCIFMRVMDSKCMSSIANGMDINLYMRILKTSVYLSKNKEAIKRFNDLDEEIQHIPHTKKENVSNANRVTHKDLQSCLSDDLSHYGNYSKLAYFLTFRSRYGQNIDGKQLLHSCKIKNQDQNINCLLKKLKVENSDHIKDIYTRTNSVLLGFNKDEMNFIDQEFLTKYPKLIEKSDITAIIKKNIPDFFSGQYKGNDGVIELNYFGDIKQSREMFKSYFEQLCNSKNYPDQKVIDSYIKNRIVATLLHESGHALDENLSNGNEMYFSEKNGFPGWKKDENSIYRPTGANKIICEREKRPIMCNKEEFEKIDFTKGFSWEKSNLPFRESNFVSYYGFQSINEDFAETIKEYYMNPKRLKEKIPEKFKQINSILSE